MNIGDHPADLELELGTSLATVSDTDFGRPDSESTSDAESFSNDDDEPDPWTEEERAEEERLTEEEHAQKAEFEKHRKDFYRIDPNLLKRPLEDDEDDAENDEAESPDRNPKEAEMDEEKDAGDDFESMETDEPSPSLSGPAPVAPEAK